MTQVKMPEPVAWVRRHPDGALTAEFLEDAVISPTRKQSGAWLPMVTTTQAEAYKDACVREALEAAAQICDDRAMSYERAAENCDGDPEDISELRSKAWVVSDIGKGIRALIPPTE